MERMWDNGYFDVVARSSPITVDEEVIESMVKDYSDLDQELLALEGMEEVQITIAVPSKHKDAVRDFLANGNQKTAPGLGKGLLKRMGLL
jgi:hypothetical protein